MLNVDKSCTGCGACAEVCPGKSITLEPDSEGFVFPHIDTASCLSCGRCNAICPALNENAEKLKRQPVNYYCATCGDADLLMGSSSGGMFILLARQVVENGGYVCGCVFSQDMVANHVVTNDWAVILRMMGSKYVQSTVHGCFPEIASILQNDGTVMFTGTACQVAALRSFLGRDYPGLLAVDILCHGVPSPLLLSKYVEYLSHKLNGAVVSIAFREKKRFGWGSEHRSCIYYRRADNTIQCYHPLLPAYFCAFFYGINLRESCYQCHYTGTRRVSDLTIGDFWGAYAKYGKRTPEGISVISCNTATGEQHLKSIRHEMTRFSQLEPAEAKGTNTNFFCPTKRYLCRDNIYDKIGEKGYVRFAIKTYFCRETCKRLVRSFSGAIKCRIIFLIQRRHP